MDESWIEHRRDDGERVGWIELQGEHCTPRDILGRIAGPPTDWLSAETVLDDLGLGFLAEPWLLLLPDGRTIRVRIVEVSTRSIRVREDAFGAAAVVGNDMADHELSFPAPPSLTPATP